MRVNELRARWQYVAIDISRPSPFGKTDCGFDDFRGISLDWPEGVLRPTYQVNFSQADFSFCELVDISFENSNFDNCLFSKSAWEDCSLNESGFVGCDFSDAKLTAVGLSWINRSNFEHCSFKHSKLKKVTFKLCNFKDVTIDGDRWTHLEFEETQFHRCHFEGKFEHCLFRGLDHLRDKAEKVRQRGGIFDSDMSSAVLGIDVEFKGELELRSNMLPSNGSMIIVAHGEIREIAKRLAAEKKNLVEPTSLWRALDILGGSYKEVKDGFQVIFKDSAIAIFGQSMGLEVFEILKAKALPYDGTDLIIIGTRADLSDLA
jgi:hypothetical protein